VFRAVAASVAGRLDFPYDAVDDLRLAVDEACAQLLAVRGDSSKLEMAISESPDEVSVQVVLHDPGGAWPPEGLSRTLAWQVLTALADEAAFGMDGQGPMVSIVKRVQR